MCVEYLFNKFVFRYRVEGLIKSMVVRNVLKAGFVDEDFRE